MTEELIVVWSGSDKDVYLCVPPIPKREPIIPATMQPADRGRYQDRSQQKRVVLQLLAERETWAAKDLQKLAGISSRMLHGLIQRWVDDGTVRRCGYGVVGLNQGRRMTGAAA